ncbi:MAG: di-heme oxidoredictase family protein [Gammaproteobacteria bacterium]
MAPTVSTVASQTASAFAREMGLTNALVTHIDCGDPDERCASGPNGGTPEVEAQLFDAVLLFQEAHSVPVKHDARKDSRGQRLFVRTGCALCHVSSLPVGMPGGERAVIHPYTDLLVHSLGECLADRDLNDEPVQSEWRTAPLWGIGAAAESGQPVRLLHNGRARSIDEAVLWHEGEANGARERYSNLSAADRRRLIEWIEQL